MKPEATTPEAARLLAHEWIEAWNSHDLEQILAHYADGFEMSSPFIAAFTNEPSGTLRGKEAVGAYWKAALERLPDLHFELIEVLAGATGAFVKQWPTTASESEASESEARSPHRCFGAGFLAPAWRLQVLVRRIGYATPRERSPASVTFAPKLVPGKPVCKNYSALILHLKRRVTERKAPVLLDFDSRVWEPCSGA